jgi:ATP-dependent protease ClpP protease subunit
MTNPTGKRWFEIQNVSETSADVYIYDYIGSYGVTASAFTALLQSLKVGTVNVRINSGGGSVFDGNAIYNALQNHPARVVVHVDGLAASMASVIAMAGDEIVMAKNAMMMIHRASSDAYGNAEELRATAVILEKLDDTIADAYVARTGGKLAAIKAAMKAETWMTADECLAAGFCDSVAESKTASASVDLTRFKNAPAALTATATVDASASFEPMPTTIATVPPVAKVIVAPVAAVITPEAHALEIKAAVEAAHAAVKVEIDGLKAAAKAKDLEIATLGLKLAEAEKLSAAKLGVAPVAVIATDETADVLAQYNALTGDAKSNYYAKNKEAIWKAKTNS